MAGRQLYQHADVALVRAAQHVELALPAWPDLTATTPAHLERWCEWLREVWSVAPVAEAVEHASPVLARQVEAVCTGQRPEARQARRMALSIARYLLRMTGRATPFGLFAGVATSSFGRELTIRWEGGHVPIARAGGAWLAEVTRQMESWASVLERLRMVANNTCFVRGGRLVVPFQAAAEDEHRVTSVDVSIRNTAVVRVAVASAASPILCSVLAAKVAAAFPSSQPPQIRRLLTELVARRVLLTELNAPSTSADAFDHLLSRLEAARVDDITEAAELMRRLREVHAGLYRQDRASSMGARRCIRRTVAEQMRAVSARIVQPVTVDLRLDCDLVLPPAIAREAAAAASALARLSPHPFGAPEWQTYHRRFFERYGVGVLAPVLDVVDADIGLGFPAGYAGSATPDPPRPLSTRDERLLALAQMAVLDDREEIVVDERLIAGLEVGDVSQPQPHAELCFEVRAPSFAALQRGDFLLAVVGVSRGVGTLAGRFIGILDRSEQGQLTRKLARITTIDPNALPVQLSFPPLVPGAADVTRAPELVPTLISLAEHRPPSDAVIGPADLAVASDGHRLYLVSLISGRRLEPMMPHALDLRAHTPPLARFLAEVTRSHVAVLTAFDWGAARRLPYLPRVRYRRTILAPARWLLHRAELPRREAPWPEWDAAFAAWRARRRLPDVVHFAEGDRRLRLDLTQPGHRVLLRAHMDVVTCATLTESPGADAHGWFGGRAHEISLPLMATTSPAPRPTVSAMTPALTIGRDHGHLPGTSRWLYAKLYGHRERQAEVLGEYLPDLLAAWDEAPLWWFIRYRDPEWHVRLRIALPDTRSFGPAADRVSTWACRLQRVGLLGDVQFATYRAETGRWGDGPAMAAAEAVFGADSRALVAQFAAPSTPHAQALCAANFVAIAIGFTGGTEAGMRWLIEHGRPGTTSPRPPRRIAEMAVDLADPADDWAALRATPGGQAITDSWAFRHRSLAAYRGCLTGAKAVNANAVLVSLLHAHHIRAVGIDHEDERTCLHLARSAALAWSARAAHGGA